MSSAAKKLKLSKPKPAVSTENIGFEEYLKSLQLKRENVAQSILDFSFNKNRVRIITDNFLVPDYCEGVVYWMLRDCRVQDNWALLFAQKLALKNEVPLHICFCLTETYMDYALRQFHFLIKGLEEIANETKELDISFHLLEGSGPEVLPQWTAEHNIGAVVCDFNPLRLQTDWLAETKNLIKKEMPLIQVDAHNVVPCWIASNKQEYSARTIRTKITSKLDEYLTEFPPLIKHPFISQFKPKPIDWIKAIESRDVDKTVGPVEWAKPGYVEAVRMLKSFIDDRLKSYASKRNDPTEDVLSNLSPWFHFVETMGLWGSELKAFYKEIAPRLIDVSGDNRGDSFFSQKLSILIQRGNAASVLGTMPQDSDLEELFFCHISVQRVSLCVQEYKTKHTESVNAFLEEAIVRRELADNFCFYNPNYDNLSGAHEWARLTLDNHRKDRRTFVYTLEQLINCVTHDELWNAAQMQLGQEGKMHGFLRMYWCKKILEWTSSPEEALEYAIYLNDHYSIDGCDPNGYVGCMWSICGVHDQGWAERNIFGKIRYMNDSGCKRKFNVAAFVARYCKSKKVLQK